jgi:hypothetical protein
MIERLPMMPLSIAANIQLNIFYIQGVHLERLQLDCSQRESLFWTWMAITRKAATCSWVLSMAVGLNIEGSQNLQPKSCQRFNYVEAMAAGSLDAELHNRRSVQPLQQR